MSDQLRSIYARWQNLEADKAAISEDLKGIIARLTYDPVTGSLFWSDPGADAFCHSRAHAVFMAMRAGRQAGCVSVRDGYVRLYSGGHSYLAHRLIWAIVHGSLPDCDVDHINGVRTDNRLANLRLATRAENTRNRRRPNANGSSGVKGVHWHDASGKWCASIGFAGNRRHLGVFADKDSAAAAYRQAELTLFGAFAHRQEA